MDKERLLATAAVCFCLMLCASTGANAQSYKPGDKVMASPSMLKDDKYYKQCTFVRIEAGSNVVNCDGTEYLVSSAYIRPARHVPPAESTPKSPPKNGKSDATAKGDGFAVGERVRVSISGLKRDDNYQPCTIITELKDNAHGVRCDPRGTNPIMEYSVRPEWIKAWPDATPEPAIPDCPFTKNYDKVSNTAPASAALFRSVIFHYQQSVSDFYDFGITFLEFKMGGTYKNVATGNGRKTIDTAPLGATIHPVKTKELMCQKSSTITLRWIREIDYGCYKNEYNEWVCRGFTTKSEKTSIPNK